MDNRIRIFLADDHDIILYGIANVLAEQPDFVIIGSARSGEGLVERVETSRPDILLLDIKMPDFDLLEALPRLVEFSPHPRLVIVSAVLDTYLAAQSAELGIAGYLLKEDALSDSLPKSIRIVANGGFVFSPQVQAYLSGPATRPGEARLSEEQYSVLCLMVDGHTNQDIALLLGKSVTAVYSIQQRIREKLGVETGEQMIIKAISDRMVPLR